MGIFPQNFFEAKYYISFNPRKAVNGLSTYATNSSDIKHFEK